MGGRTRTLLLTVLLALVLAPPATARTDAARGAAAREVPRCFGAASRDPDVPCRNRALKRMVRPSPGDAVLEASAPCRLLRGARPEVCVFGVGRSRARRFVALMGDSHSVHWRAALARVAAKRRWRGYTLYRSQCPLTFGRSPSPRCAGFGPAAVAWVRKHREISLVVTSANSGSGIVPRDGQSHADAYREGYQGAWDALPASVRTVAVLADVPHATPETAPCVERAHRRGRDAGARCSRPRSEALRPDRLAQAAQASPSPRVHLIDLSDTMCDEDECFPVVGGALVIKDFGHLTRTFSTSLAPILDRRLRAACGGPC